MQPFVSIVSFVAAKRRLIGFEFYDRLQHFRSELGTMRWVCEILDLEY